jgi:hypothetical protein
MSRTRIQHISRRLVLGACAALVVGAIATPASAQDVITKESAAAIKTAFLADLDTVKTKFIGLAEAFPQDKYSWRPMDGVRSVSEVLMLAAQEGYAFVPGSFGGQRFNMPQADMQNLSKVTDKAAVIDHLNKAFAYAKTQVEGLDPATLTGKRRIMGREMGFADGVIAIGGDLHEHLGQLIAYARTNRVVPPWSK